MVRPADQEISDTDPEKGAHCAGVAGGHLGKHQGQSGAEGEDETEDRGLY